MDTTMLRKENGKYYVRGFTGTREDRGNLRRMENRNYYIAIGYI